MNIVSFGGGTNSAAMIIGMVERNIPIDLIMFSDTGGEKPHTYQFIETFSDWLAFKGYPRVEVVQQTAGGKPATLEEHCLKYRRFPGVAYGTPDCAVQFKIRPQEKYCNNHPKCKAVWRFGGKINKYIGYDAGEQRRIDKNRAKYDSDKKYIYHFPLIEWGWEREDCVAAIKKAGLTPPGKSSCFYCPNINKDDIRRLWEGYPDLFDRAVAMERNAGKVKKDGEMSSIIGLGRTWTWESYREIWLHNEEFRKNQFVIPGFEDFMGGCCCGMPCGCNDG